MRRVIRRRLEKNGQGRNVVGDIQGVIAANVGRRGQRTGVSTKSHVRVVQRGGRTEVTESCDEGA